MAQKIAVLSQKGGTGKTTAVRTLTDVFRQAGLDVLVVDLDPQGNLSDYFDVPADATPTVADLLSGDAKAKAATRRPARRNVSARWRTAVVLPVPPFWLRTASLMAIGRAQSKPTRAAPSPRA